MNQVEKKPPKQQAVSLPKRATPIKKKVMAPHLSSDEDGDWTEKQGGEHPKQASRPKRVQKSEFKVIKEEYMSSSSSDGEAHE